MTRTSRLASAVSCGLLLLGAACARPASQVAGAPAPRAAAASDAPAEVRDTVHYRALRRRLAAFAGVSGAADSVRAFDMDSLRRAFAASSDYAPYSLDTDLRKAMFAALDRSAFAEARRLADSALALNYLDIFAHIGADMAARKSGDERAHQFHEAMVRGLLGAIFSSGEGTAQSPWVVLSVDEEYAVLQTQGLRRSEQALSRCANGRDCDVLTVEDGRGGESRRLWFDVSTPKGWLVRQFRER